MQGTHIQLPILTKINKRLIISLISIFILESILNQMEISLTKYLALNIGTMAQGFIYTLLSYIFIPRDLMSGLFECLILWFLGSELEIRWGAKRYIFYLVMITLSAGIIYLLASAFMNQVASFQGIGVISAALCVSYAILFPERHFTFMFIFPMKARFFCLLLAGITLYTAFFGGGGATAIGLLGAMLMGYLGLMIMANPLVKSFFETGHRTLKNGGPRKRSHLRIVGQSDSEDDSEDNKGKKPPTYH